MNRSGKWLADHLVMQGAKHHKRVNGTPYDDGRRRFLKRCGQIGVGFGALATGSNVWKNDVSWPGPDALAATPAASDVATWLGDVGKPFSGSEVRMVTENTAPSAAIQALAREEFTPATGIKVAMELLPLERVLQKIGMDITHAAALYDLYYLDQSWIARFADDTEDPRDLYAHNTELAMPDYDMTDFLPQLVDGISMYRNKMVGVPFDIPLFIMLYRRDLFERLGLEVPSTLPEYLAVVDEIQHSMAPRIFGTTGQMKSGHYSLTCEWTAWLWGNGGSIFDSDGFFSGGDDRGIEGLAYLRELQKRMPPHVDSWTWDGQAQSLLQGLAGVTLTWGEIFPLLDDPERSQVAGLFDAAPPPRAAELRLPEQCGFGEIPNIGHQGGSALALSRLSTNKEAAWLFLQWATSSDVQTRASLLGGGGSPTRASVFDDIRIKQAAGVQAGTTRHFDTVRWTIENAMGSEPGFPAWPEVANNVIPRELGRYFAGDHDSPVSAMAAIKSEADRLAAPYRG